MKSSDIVNAIAFQFTANRMQTFAIEGQPGVGKSAVVYQAAKQLGVPVIEFRPCNHGIEDLVGLPDFIERDGKRFSTFAKPDWLPLADRDGPEGIFFIDEFAQAAPAMQNSLSSLIHAPRRLHDYELPKGWMVVTAFNSAKHRAATHKMPTHIADRLAPKVEMDFDLNDWVKWAEDAGLSTSLIAFAKWRENILTSFDPKLDINCTPRSLAMCDPYVDAPAEIQHELINGTIGEGNGAELLGFLRIWKNLPDMAYLLKHPDTTPVPDKPDVLFALTQALSYRCDINNADHLAKFVKRMPSEYQVTFFKETFKRTKEVSRSQAFRDFLQANQALIV